jgi:hypothetical protein
VRKDGATVDPLDVLPAEAVDSRLSAIDCERAPIFVPLGSFVRVDFKGMFGDTGRIESVRALPLNDGPTLGVSVEGLSVVHLSSAIDFDGPDGEDQYNLTITLDGANENRVLSCPFVVQRQVVPTTFYVRAVPDDGEAEAAAAEELPPTPTPTENPWPQGPNYGVPVAPGSGAQSPAYASPPGSGVVVQSPSYGSPPSLATPVAPQ